jgi:hypothetical protein
MSQVKRKGRQMLAGNSAAGPGKPLAKIIRETIEDFLLKINFPMEQKERWSHKTKGTHLNPDCHS